ncbi:MAG: TauD/TfdA family dioxygenase [Pseudomonadota bacterium]|nr:TauD/TfdA family dioxygenase [Pseudomonadota bacterium]
MTKSAAICRTGISFFRHQWRPGDFLIWENRKLQHARRPFDESKPRELRRTQIM